MKETVIICVGNRFVHSDASGMMVYDILCKNKPYSGIRVVEGGIAGINLYPVVRDFKRVILVDTVRGFEPEKGISLLTYEEILSKTDEKDYDHNGGFLYLIKSLPGLLGESIPEIIFIGISDNPDPDIIKRAACLCLKMAQGHDVKTAHVKRMC